MSLVGFSPYIFLAGLLISSVGVIWFVGRSSGKKSMKLAQADKFQDNISEIQKSDESIDKQTKAKTDKISSEPIDLDAPWLP